MPEPPPSESRQQEENHRLELVATVMMALAAILAAWAAFQSAKWSGRQSIAFSEAAASRTVAARFATRADQQAALDANIFIAWVQAVAAEVSPDELRARGYEPKPGTLSNFLFARFPKELESAVEAWLATRPFQNAEAPATPFEMPEYRREALAEAERLNENAEARSEDARTFNLHSDRYVATNVLFAMILFFAGVATKLESRLAQRLMLGLAFVFMLAACSVLVTFPVALD